mgnify:CR=1 FL=1
MYNKTKGGIYLKNGLLTLEAGAMMSLAESSVEARETQKHIKKSLTEELALITESIKEYAELR